MAIVEWRGPAIQAALVEAARRALIETGGEAVTEAKRITGNEAYDTGALQGGIMIDPADVQVDGGLVSLNWGVDITWGSHDVNYALYVETGTGGRPGVYMLRRGQDHAVADDALAKRVREHFERLT